MARTLGFTQAARRLGLRRSTVSRHVRRPDPGRPVRDADLETGVRRAVVAASTLVPQAESIRTFRAPAQPFAEGQGPLTPSLTLKQQAIERTYGIGALRRA
ncbi:hypothetical protein KYY02_08610 [Streptomyces pimonensis]|uniref:HTH lysR-type domain-containing protein n=1 Tax=Streptomyces pimonensis TaxID=2860288 RepID=A0ABV4IVR1_9ACTN